MKFTLGFTSSNSLFDDSILLKRKLIKFVRKRKKIIKKF